MEKARTRVSVIVPIYNVEAYLGDCLRSIANQTYKDFEAILVDDGSRDSSGKICDDFCESDGRFRVIHQENQGVDPARNNGVKAAKGEYVYFVDGDDYVHPEMLQCLMETLNETGCAISMVKGKMVDSIGQCEDAGTASFKILSQEDYIAGTFSESGSDWQYMAVWNKLYPRELIEDIPFVEMPSDDMDFNLRTILRVDKVAFVDRELYYWVQRSGSITHSGITKKYINNIKTYLTALDYFPEENHKYRGCCLTKLYKRILSIRHDARGTENESYANGLIDDVVAKTYAEFKLNPTIPKLLKSEIISFYKFPVLYDIFRWINDHR